MTDAAGNNAFPTVAALADTTTNPSTYLSGSLNFAYNGTTWDRILNGHGTAAKSLRVELPTDGTGVVGLNAGTNIVGKVGFDPAANGVQVNAALPAGGNTIGKFDLLGNAGVALDAATGAAVPANAVFMGAKASSGNMAGVIACDNYAKYDASTSGDTQVVAASGSTAIYVCGYTMGIGATSTNVKLDYGTGSNCVTGTTALTPAAQFTPNGGKVISSPFWNGLKTPASQALCVNASAANPVQVEVWYAQF
jgi:hypothetical protein